MLLRVRKNTSSIGVNGTVYTPDASGNIDVPDDSPNLIELVNTLGLRTPAAQDAADAQESAAQAAALGESAAFASLILAAMSKAQPA